MMLSLSTSQLSRADVACGLGACVESGIGALVSSIIIIQCEVRARS